MSHKDKSSLLVVAVISALTLSISSASATSADGSTRSSLWEHDNLIAWCVVPFDAKNRGPEERSAMLQRLGFKHFAYDWRDKDVPTFDAEMDSLQKHGIDLLGWLFPMDATNPQTTATLEVFKRHHVHPQLWVALSAANEPKDWNDWRRLLPADFPTLKSDEDYENFSPANKAQIERIAHDLDTPKNPQEQKDRVSQEAKRIAALATLARAYGSKVELYNHNGWFGMEENQLAIIERSKPWASRMWVWSTTSVMLETRITTIASISLSSGAV
jgi:hypothetical protein